MKYFSIYRKNYYTHDRTPICIVGGEESEIQELVNDLGFYHTSDPYWRSNPAKHDTFNYHPIEVWNSAQELKDSINDEVERSYKNSLRGQAFRRLL